MTGLYEIQLPLGAPCAACGATQPIAADQTCATCGGQLPRDVIATVQKMTKERRAAFRGRLERLATRMRQVAAPPLEFVSRGTPMSHDDHLRTVIEPILCVLPQRSDEVAKLFAQSPWDPADATTVEAFKRLVTLLDQALSDIERLRSMLVPATWRAVHRGLTRAAGEVTRGQITLARSIAAPNATAALEFQAQGQAALDAGKAHAEKVSAVIEFMKRAPRRSPFQSDGSLNVAQLAWCAVEQRPTPIVAGASLVRTALHDIPGIPELPDHHALLLLPGIALGATIVDLAPPTVHHRARQ